MEYVTLFIQWDARWPHSISNPRFLQHNDDAAHFVDHQVYRWNDLRVD